jgi:hypothetical protein
MSNYSAEAKMQSALDLFREEKLAELPEDAELEYLCVPPGFEEKMLRFIRRKTVPYDRFINTWGKQAALFAIVFLLAVSAAVFSVKALRDPVVEFFVEVYESFSTMIFLPKNEASSFSGKLENSAFPAFIPDGYTLVSQIENETTLTAEYKNVAGKLLIYEQCLLSSTQINIDTEGIEIEGISVSGTAGIYFHNKGYHNLIWNDEIYGYSLMSDSLGRTVLLFVAESVE